MNNGSEAEVKEVYVVKDNDEIREILEKVLTEDGLFNAIKCKKLSTSNVTDMNSLFI